MFSVGNPSNFVDNEYKTRQDLLKKYIKEKYPLHNEGYIILFAAFEKDGYSFRQENSFYYLTGIEEPAAVCLMNIATDEFTVYIPDYSIDRSIWVSNCLTADKKQLDHFGITQLKLLGDKCAGYQLHPFFNQESYTHLIDDLNKIIKDKISVFTLNHSNSPYYIEQQRTIEKMSCWIPNLNNYLIDIADFVADMRRTKSMRELENIYKAIEITLLAHNAAAESITDKITEAEVQASLEYMMVAAQSTPACASIVASGKNSTILHYTQNTSTMHNGNLVIVDIGARYNYYCADITRTYPVSGIFSARQKELYTIVLETQEYIAGIAKPGYWLNNKERPEKSLNHLAQAFLKGKGYSHYFPHAIGHLMGMDVHDVGDLSEPLKIGDIFTIEPGIYIKDENIGIRIEDNYWVVEDEVICLSEGFGKSIQDIENLMQEKYTSQEINEKYSDA